MYEAFPLAPELYRIAKDLDPTRPVVDSDGVWVAGFATGERDRDTLDLYFMQFDVFSTPLDKPAKYDCPSPKKPVVSHETGNYVTFPRLDLIDLFQHNFKPFWFLETRDRLEQMGLLDEAELWAENSERLYFLCHKINTEDLRRKPTISGHHWWLLQDYWTTTNGLVDTYFRPKPGIAPDKVRQFNADVVLLADGLELTYRGGESLDLAFLVSNYSPEALADGVLGWRVQAEDRAVAEGAQRVSNAPQGEVTQLDRVSVPVPTTERPVRLAVAAWLEVDGQRYENDWTTWAYPATPAPPRFPNPVYASPDLAPALAAFGVRPLPDENPLPHDAAYVGTYLSTRTFDALTRGACVFLIQPPALLPTAMTRFKTAWWRGHEGDNNAGTVVYDHPVTRPMAPEGWCDASWYDLIENSHGYILNDLPSQPEILVRGVEVWSACRNKALLFQARVGEGSLIVCGLNLNAADGDGPVPAAQWLTARLLEYASALPKPTAELPVDLLRERAAEMPNFEGPFVEGFSRLVRNEGEEGQWFTYREARGVQYVCRQTGKGHVIEWQTAPVPDPVAGEALTFVFAGGIGWISEPRKEGFTLSVNGQDGIEFDVSSGFTTWRNDDLGVVLTLFSKTVTNEDNAGLFYVRVPAALLEPGKPCRLAVRSNNEGSRRWFALHPYGDVLGPHEKQ
jgi:hypothetical protein